MEGPIIMLPNSGFTMTATTTVGDPKFVTIQIVVKKEDAEDVLYRLDNALPMIFQKDK